MTKIQKKFNEYIVASAELVKHLNESNYDVDNFDEETDRLNDVIDVMGGDLGGKTNDFTIYNDKSGDTTIENLSIDDYIKSVIGKDYFYDKRCWEYLYDIVKEMLEDMPILDENVIYEDVKLEKDYIVEGVLLKKGTTVRVEENIDSPLVGTFTNDDEDEFDFTKSDVEIMAEPLVNYLKDMGYLNIDNDNYLENYDKVIDFCLTSYQRYFKMPSFIDVENLAKEKFNEPKLTVVD